MGINYITIDSLVKTLEADYPDTLEGVDNEHILIKRKAEQDMLNYIKLLIEKGIPNGRKNNRG